ncbi:hypothetical protein M427DRAFT_69981 [Gonapodya prolifera JEL478]|uniref:Uncharacterized protein n=1 Tax=Gonapodya prolifera (strain JEL478) TaxID=1344416 RepID=A0A139AGE5_GONPJ|nr:hypothetical protein M427DRAFT_69981 [Gonapodya prolifera JEL478]|eukprot:KXS15634.1 hypothetical protein M427DRAFT_69981 [Gonapodya prolifera JEL478]
MLPFGPSAPPAPSTAPEDTRPPFTSLPTSTLFTHLDRIRAHQVRLALDHMALTSLQKEGGGADVVTMDELWGEVGGAKDGGKEGKGKEGAKERYEKNSERFARKQADVGGIVDKLDALSSELARFVAETLPVGPSPSSTTTTSQPQPQTPTTTPAPLGTPLPHRLSTVPAPQSGPSSPARRATTAGAEGIAADGVGGIKAPPPMGAGAVAGSMLAGRTDGGVQRKAPGGGGAPS